MMEKIKDNLFIFLTGIIYYFSFHGITVGDRFYKSFEAGYPLFLNSNFAGKCHWFGFLSAHLLNYPTLRSIQILLAKIRLLPLPITLFQMTNLALSLATLKLLYSILLRIDIGRLMAMATTILFAFSYAFYANMNAEFHHFGIFLITAYIWFLVGIEKNQQIKGNTIFMFCLCLALAPLYHIENLIYSACVILYVLLKKDLRVKFKPHIYPALFGLMICPLFLISCAFAFQYYDFGRPGVIKYISEIPDMLWIKRFGSMAQSTYSTFSLMNVYIMLRAFLESFSIVSRVAKVAQHYKDILFYSNHFLVNLTLGIVFTYCLAFLLVSLKLFSHFLKSWKKVFSPVKLLFVMLTVYIVGFGVFLTPLLSEFFISSAMIYCILLGYVFNKQSKRWKLIYLFLVLLTIISNVYLYIYPQKISAASINKIFNEIEAKNKGAGEFDIFRISFMIFPEETDRRRNFKIYTDEHAYETKEDVLKYIDIIDGEFSKGKKIFLISAGFLLGDNKDINFDTAIPMGMDEDPNLIKNMKYLVNYINHKYKLVITKDYFYNFGTLGQLGKIAVVELK